MSYLIAPSGGQIQKWLASTFFCPKEINTKEKKLWGRERNCPAIGKSLKEEKRKKKKSRKNKDRTV